jgi:DNA-binding NtrC family response regulator
MKKHILIVDDEEDIRSLLGEFLGSSGYTISAVPSLAAALESIRKQPPSLIISDLQLEDADGLEMIAKLRAAHPDAPVILLTGVLFGPKAVNDVLLSKVTCYLAKTCSLANILENVRRLTETPIS